MKRLRAAALFRLLTQMMRFAAGSLMAYSSEIGSFALLIKVVFRRESAWVVLFSMCLARALSMLVQYSINRYIVFRSRIEWSSSFARYFLVNVSLLGCSYLLVRLARPLVALDITIVKMGVDLVLFFANFALNRLFVFAVKHTASPEGEHKSEARVFRSTHRGWTPLLQPRPRRQKPDGPSATESARPDHN